MTENEESVDWPDEIRNEIAYLKTKIEIIEHTLMCHLGLDSLEG